VSEELTPEELKTLKELVSNLQAGSRLGRLIKSTAIWLSSVLGVGYVVFEVFLKHKA
jgi:hypothetical protein